MKTVYLHIGTHKTGSTSIQRFLARAQEALAEQGVLYPETGRPRENWSPYGQHRLRWALTGKWERDDERLWENLRQEIHEHPGERVVVSAEGFETCTTQEIQRVIDQLAPFPIRIILYLRPPAQFLRAAYAQRVKMEGYHTSFAQCVDDMISRCNYLSLVSRWEQFAEIESIDIRLFEKVKNEPGLEASFADAAGIDFDKVRSFVASPANTSPPNNVVRVIRWINKMGSVGPNFRLWHALLERTRSNVLGKRWPGRWISSAAKLLLDNVFVTKRTKEIIQSEIGRDHRKFLEEYNLIEDKEYLTI